MKENNEFKFLNSWGIRTSSLVNKIEIKSSFMLLLFVFLSDCLCKNTIQLVTQKITSQTMNIIGEVEGKSIFAGFDMIVDK